MNRFHFFFIHRIIVPALFWNRLWCLAMVFLAWCYLIRFSKVPLVSSLAPSITIWCGTPTGWNDCVKSSPDSDFSDMCHTREMSLSITNTWDVILTSGRLFRVKECIRVHHAIHSVVSYLLLLCAIPAVKRVYNTPWSLLHRYFDCLFSHFQANAPSPWQQAGVSFIISLFRRGRCWRHIPWWQLHLHRVLYLFQ